MKIIEVKENKKQYLDLLLLADEQEDMVDRYLDNGKMYVLDDNGVKCECVITDKENDILEIKNIATVPEYQGKGYARALIEFIVNNYREQYAILTLLLAALQAKNGAEARTGATSLMRPTLVNIKACFAGTPQESTVEQDLNYFASKGIVGKIESAKEVLFVMTSAAIDTERMNQIIDETRKAITFEKLVADSTYDVAKQFMPTDYLKWRMRIINVSPANAKQEAEKVDKSENHIPTFFLFAKNEADQGKIKDTVTAIFDKVGERCIVVDFSSLPFTDALFSKFIESKAKEKYGISTSRGTVGDDIKALQELGVEIEVVPSTQKRFSLIGRRFDLPELKTLIDAVESARFVPPKKSAALVNKLGSLTSLYNKEKLVRNVDVENRIKADNEKIYYIMEALNDAINASKKVSFQYFTYNVRKEQKLKYDGYTYVFSPYKLIWNGDYYYAVGFSEKHKGIGSFRVDRIVRCPKILDDDAVQPPKNFDLNAYLNPMFRMYNGQKKQIELVCSNDVMDAIIDKFGKDVYVLANDMKSFRAVIETSVGSAFYSWIFGFGGRVVIKSPEDVKAEYSSMVLNAGKSLGLFEYGESVNQTVQRVDKK